MASRVPTIRDLAKSPKQAPKAIGVGTKSSDKLGPKGKSPKAPSPRQWLPFSSITTQDKGLYTQEPAPERKKTRSRSPGSRSPRSKPPATHVPSTKPPETQPNTTHHVTPKATTTHPPTTQATTTKTTTKHPPTTQITTTHTPTTQTTTTKTTTHPPTTQTAKTEPPKTQTLTTKTTTPRIPAIQVTAPRGAGYLKTFKDDSINCPICTKHYDQPRMLPCLHSFCHACLVFYIQDGRYDAGSKGFPCPCCRKLAYSPGMTKARPEKWAELFPVNSLLADVVDLSSLKKGTKVCDPCKKNKTKSDVHTYCKNCRDALCENCAKTHRGLRSCKNHTVLSIAQFEAAISSLKVDEEFCPKHEGKVMEHFCPSHSKLCCSTCTTEEHRQCDKVVSVKESAQKCRETNEIPTLEGVLAKYNDHLNTIMKNRSSQLKKLESKKGKILEEFLDIKRQIIMQLEKMEKDLKTKLDQTHKQETKKIHDEVETCQEIQSGVVNATELLQVADNHGADSQVVDTVEKVKHECVYYEDKIGGINRKVRTIDYHLALDKNLEHLAKKLNQFGRIDVKTSPSGLPEPPKIANSLGLQSPQSLQSSKTKNTSLKPSPDCTGKEADEIAEFNGKCNDDAQDSNCWFTGAQFLHDGRILLVDRNNRKLKMFSKDFNVISELVFSSKPWDVTVISNREVAITLPEECRIQFVSVSLTVMSFVRAICTEDPCFGIHYANGKIMTVAYDGDPPNLKVLSPEGEELTYVSVDADGFTLFSKPIYVTSTPDGSEIFVTDERLGSVINLTENGELNFTYSAIDLGHAAGILLDNDANIYVCGNTSNTVQVLNSKGDRVKILATGENISYPRAIAYEPKEKKLLVTQGDKDDVKIYSLVGNKRKPE